MENKKLIVKINKTVRSHFSEDEIIRIIQEYTNEKFGIENSDNKGLFLELPNGNVALHAGEVRSRNAFLAQYWPPIIKFLDETKIIQHIDKKIDLRKISSSYHQFIFKCLRTIGVEIVGLSDEVLPWTSLNEFISFREAGEKDNNESSYVTVNDNSIVLVGKTYGAQAGESLIILATLNKLKGDKELIFTPMPETTIRESKKLPQNISDFINKIGARFIDADLGKRQFEKSKNTEEENEIRDQALFKMNLDKKFDHECYICGAKGLGILVASHIDRVTDIKKRAGIDLDEKSNFATSMENGLWLCRNHDILFEYGNMWFDETGNLKFREQFLAEENKPLHAFLKRDAIEEKHFTSEMQKNLELHRKRTKN